MATESVAEAFLAQLKSRGVDYFYVGAGTDTAPIVEAYARQPESGLDFPTPIVASHENLAVGMAHGHTMISGRAQAVMLHVSVGAANAVCGVMNAARSQVPMFFTAGRTPLFEKNAHGARDNAIHWGQEMFDQAGMLREFVKWDYELRDGRNVADVVDRGLAISNSAPRGPVYLTLPREVLGQPQAGTTLPPAPPACSDAHPDPAQVKVLAAALARAAFPVIVCAASGADPATVADLVAIADRFGIAVAESRPRHTNFPTTHALHAGFDMPALFARADALLFLESDVPWMPGKTAPREGAFVAQAGVDPLFTRIPLRTFPADLHLTASVRPLLALLAEELERCGAATRRAARRESAAAFSSEWKAAAAGRARRDAEQGGAISKLFLTRCLDEVRAPDAIIVNEYSALREQLTVDEPGTFFHHPSAGGLGWGLPAALGAKQAAPDRQVFAVLGDGAYLFSNPACCHQAAAMHKLPVLTVVFDNGGWDAVEKSALGMYPDSHTARHVARKQMAPLSSLQPVPDFAMYARASGGHGETVERREDLLPALRRALDVVQRERRQALVHVHGS
jgi:acetolactate synthase-1/2/3 large subunit